MVVTIYFILFFTVLITICITSLFIYLLCRKVFLNYHSKRSVEYYNLIYFHISKFITRGTNKSSRLLSTKTAWKQHVIIDILFKVSESVSSEEEHKRIQVLSTNIGLEKRMDKLLNDKRWWKQLEAIRAIGLLELTSFIPVLEKKLKDSHHEVVLTAARALSRLNRHETIVALMIEEERDSSKNMLGQLGELLMYPQISHKRDIELITDHLNNVSSRLQGLFIEILGKRMIVHTLPLITPYLQANEVETRLKTLRAIGDLTITLNDKEILPFLYSDIWNERVLAIYVVQKCRIFEAISILVEKSLADVNWWVRLRSAEVLYSFGPLGEQQLIWASEYHHDPYARDISGKVLEEKKLEEFRR